MKDESNSTSEIDPAAVVGEIETHVGQLSEVMGRLEQVQLLLELTDHDTVITQTARNYRELAEILDRAGQHLESLAPAAPPGQNAGAVSDAPVAPAADHVDPGQDCDELTENASPAAPTSGSASPGPLPHKQSPASAVRVTPAAMVGTAPPVAPKTIRAAEDMTVHVGVERMMVDRGISFHELARVIKDPDATWLGENPNAQDKPTVAVRDDAEWGVIYYLMGGRGEVEYPHVITIRPREALYRDRRGLTSGYRKAGAGASNSGSRKPVIDSLAVFIKRVEEAGLEYAPGTKHGKVTQPGSGVTVTVPNTPSDVRSWNNTVAMVRRLLGVDL